MRVRRIKKIVIMGILLILFISLIYSIFFKTTYIDGSYTSVDVPSWLEGKLCTTTPILGKESGPVVESGEDSYGIFKIRFYDASTNLLITDKAVLKEIVSMFIYTDEPFVYDEGRTKDGACFFYYNGVLPACYSASLFSGFKGSEHSILNGTEVIDCFYLKVQGSTFSSAFSDNLQEALNEF